MGIFTVCDILTGNPGFIDLIDKDKKLYNWNNNVRSVLKDGTVTKIGQYFLDGNVRIQDKQKSLFDLFPKKHEYIVGDKSNLNDIVNYEYDGFLLNDTVYNFIKKHKDYKKCVKNKFLYNILEKFALNDKTDNFEGIQEMYIPSNNDNSSDDLYIKKKLWTLVDPKLPDGVKNKDRIMKIINNFYKFVCKDTKTESKCEILQYKLVYNTKFWNIEYSDDIQKVYFGKIGTQGRVLSKKSKRFLSEKLVESKIKKGYEVISKKKIKQFTL